MRIAITIVTLILLVGCSVHHVPFRAGINVETVPPPPPPPPPPPSCPPSRTKDCYR